MNDHLAAFKKLQIGEKLPLHIFPDSVIPNMGIYQIHFSKTDTRSFQKQGNLWRRVENPKP